MTFFSKPQALLVLNLDEIKTFGQEGICLQAVFLWKLKSIGTQFFKPIVIHGKRVTGVTIFRRNGQCVGW